MKRLAILFLLTTVLVSFTFAEFSVKGGLDFNNFGEGNDERLDPNKREIQIYTDFLGSVETPLGPGAIGAELGLSTALSFQSKSEDSAYVAGPGDTYIRGFYQFPAGPGTLDIGLSAWSDFGNFHFNIGYTGLAAGPATLGFDVEYDLNTAGLEVDWNTNTVEKKVFAEVDSDLAIPDELILKVTADFAFGLSVTYKFSYVFAGIDLTRFGSPFELKSYIKEIAYLDIAYTLPSIPLKIGAELSGTGGIGWNGAGTKLTQQFFGKGGAGDVSESSLYSVLGGAGLNAFLGYAGMTLKPYAEYTITEKVSAGAFFKLQHLGTDKDKNGRYSNTAGAWKKYGVEVSPGVWVKYAF
jgi:hypothetical protein